MILWHVLVDEAGQCLVSLAPLIHLADVFLNGNA